MVEIAEVVEEEDASPSPPPPAAESRSQERYADADEIEAALSHVTRASARLHLENLASKLRREGKALERVAASQGRAGASASSPPKEKAAAMEVKEAGDGGESSPPRSRAPPAAAAAKDPPPAPPRRAPAAIVHSLPSHKYRSFPTYYFDAGKYDSPVVTVYVPLEGVGSHDKSKIRCDFAPSSLDLIVEDFDGETYRLLNDNLEKDIDPSKSKRIVKPNKIVLKLGKVKGEYGYDSWQQLTAKKPKKRDASGKSTKDDPAAGIMDMMRDMYDGGDDAMKKMIGETMYKQRTGQLDREGMGTGGGMGGMGDMGMGMGM
ncbi:hypothetical protein ACHAWF_009254 [Thalassiosira exigua]